MAKGLIFVPRVDDCYYTTDAQLLSGILPWLGPEYVRLYAELKGGHSVKVIYEDLFPDLDIYKMVSEAPVDTLIGISATSLSYGHASRIMQTAHNRGMRVVIGGPHARIAWRLILEHRPYALCSPYQGEVSFLALLDKMPPAEVPGLVYTNSSGIVHNPASLINYEELPLINTSIDYEPFFKRWRAACGSLFQRDKSKGISIRGIKGCAKAKPCAFCSVERMEAYNPITRARRIFQERVDARERFGPDVFIRECNDDLPTRACLEELCRLNTVKLDTSVYVYARIAQVRNNWKLVQDAGYTHVLLGLESYGAIAFDEMGKSSDSLNQLHALLEETKSSGMCFYLSGILGWPGESPETLSTARRTIETLLRYEHIKGIAIGCLFLYPYTDFYNKLMAQPGMAQKHSMHGDIPDYRMLLRDWLRCFSGSLELDTIESVLRDTCAIDPRINYISGFVQ